LIPKLKAKPIRTASGVSNSCFRVNSNVSQRRLYFSFVSLNFIMSLCNLHISHYKVLYVTEYCTLQIAVVAVMCKPHRCPHIAMTGNICV